MGKVAYTVKRSPVFGHDLDDAVELDIEFRDAIRSRAVRKEVHRASGGITETIYYGADTSWELVFGPFNTEQMNGAVKEFLDSTAEGEEFRAWIYDEDDSPGTYLDLRRTNTGYTFARIRTASLRVNDEHTVSFTAIETEP